jgi:hypothetical protein
VSGEKIPAFVSLSMLSELIGAGILAPFLPAVVPGRGMLIGGAMVWPGYSSPPGLSS